MRILLAALLAAGAGCRRAAPASAPAGAPAAPDSASVAMTAYDAPSGGFRCLAPASWKLLEDSALGPDEVSFLDSSAASAGRDVRISISRYPNAVDRYVDADAYLRALVQPDGRPIRAESEEVGGRRVTRFELERPFKSLHSSRERYLERESVALVPAPGGFFRLEHVAPAADAARTRPAFEALLRSFEPKAPPSGRP